MSTSSFTFLEAGENNHTLPKPVIDVVPDFGMVVKIFEPTQYIPIIFYAEVYADVQESNSSRKYLTPLNGTFLKHYNEYYYFATPDAVMKHNDTILYRIEYAKKQNVNSERFNKSYSEVLDLQKYFSTTTEPSHFDIRDFYRRKK